MSFRPLLRTSMNHPRAPLTSYRSVHRYSELKWIKNISHLLGVSLDLVQWRIQCGVKGGRGPLFRIGECHFNHQISTLFLKCWIHPCHVAGSLRNEMSSHQHNNTLSTKGKKRLKNKISFESIKTVYNYHKEQQILKVLNTVHAWISIH